ETADGLFTNNIVAILSIYLHAAGFRFASGALALRGRSSSPAILQNLQSQILENSAFSSRIVWKINPFIVSKASPSPFCRSCKTERETERVRIFCIGFGMFRP